MRFLLVLSLLKILFTDLNGQFTITIREICEETNCTDGKDNDGDSFIDCNDLDCYQSLFNNLKSNNKSFDDKCTPLSPDAINLIITNPDFIELNDLHGKDELEDYNLVFYANQAYNAA